MQWCRTHFPVWIGVVVLAVIAAPEQTAWGQADAVASTREFSRERELIRPQPGEALWLDIPWEIDVWAARERAAKEGKPIFFLTAGGRSPLGDC